MEYNIRKNALPTYFRKAITNADLPIHVTQECALGSEPINALHYHNATEVGLCIKGEGESHIGDRVYRHTEGYILIARPYQPHLSTTDEGQRGYWIWITIDPQALLRSAGVTDPETAMALMRESGAITGVFSPEELPELKDAVNTLIKAYNSTDAFAGLSAYFAAVNLLILLARLSRSESLEHGSPPEEISYKAILPAIEYISSHLDDSEGLAEKSLAARCHMSVSNLRRLFNLSAGLSPKAFIVRSRMAYAEYLLRATELSVLDISTRVGYGELSGFNRVFVRHFGTSPGKYRRNNK